MRKPRMAHRKGRTVAPGRVLIPVTMTILAVGLVAVSGLREPTRARPPSTPPPIPADAFKPVTLPPADDGSRNPLPRRPDPDRDPDAAREPELSPEPLPSPDPATSPDPSPPSGPTHTVREGDTLWQIAAWHRADLELILRWNEPIDPRRLIAGQRVVVPGGAPMPARPKVSPPASRSSSPEVRVSEAGPHLWPLPVRGDLTRRFSSAHPGVDIAAPAGTTVRAIAAGSVVWAGWRSNGGGFVVEIRHPDGMVSTYNHNRAVAVSRGEQVDAGQRIAWVGSTGWATGPHLDLRIEMDGRLVDPLALYSAS